MHCITNQRLISKLGKFAITVTDDSETSLIIASMSMTAGNVVKYAVVG